jgi:Na+-translocating ferredoxin:NAD+ oxidoreductase RnfD subunit
MATNPRILEANTRSWDRRPETEQEEPVLPLFLRTPKGQLLCIFGLLLLIAAPFEGGLAVLPNLLAGGIAACTVDVAFTYWERRRWIVPTSALLSGLIVAFILGTQEPWQVVAWVAGFASVTKHVIANRREHIFNPAALALLLSVVIFGSGQSWWGALGDLPEAVAVVLVATGVFIVERLNKFPMVLTFLAAYFVGFAVAAWVNASAVAEMFRAPFLQSVLFLAFFMLTDPPTSPNRFADQVWFGLVAAVVAVASQLLGVGQVYLLLAVLAANVFLAWRRWQSRRVVPATPRERRRARRAVIAQQR